MLQYVIILYYYVDISIGRNPKGKKEKRKKRKKENNSKINNETNSLE